MTYITKPILMKTKTNLHVGSESINYNIVDKTVQKDSITTLPVINASSSKGALRYHFKTKDTDETLMEQIFGKEASSSGDGKEGELKFLDSYLLFLPLRATNKPFYHVTSKANLLSFLDFYSGLCGETEGLEKARKIVEKLEENKVLNADDTQIEDHSCDKQDLNIDDLLALFPDNIKPQNIAIFSDENFIDACEHLPIIARNKIEVRDTDDNVIEKSNLWYEEIVPRESIFYTAHLAYKNHSKRTTNRAKHTYNDFYEQLQNGYIQVGANASIGFGLCTYAMLDIECKEEENA